MEPVFYCTEIWKEHSLDKDGTSAALVTDLSKTFGIQENSVELLVST